MAFNRVEIDLDALRHNFRLLAARSGPDVVVLAMVKSEAYGHGLESCARALAAAGARAFGVAEVEEGIRLRQAGIEGDIVVTLGLAPDDDPADVVRHRLQPVVFDEAGARRLAAAGVDRGRDIPVHLKIDIGMGRLGVMADDAALLVQTVGRMAGLRIAGLMAHYPLADEDQEQTAWHLAVFRQLIDRLQDNLPSGCLFHIANSAAMLGSDAGNLAMVRPGIALYGCTPAGVEDPGLRPVMTMKSSVVQVKEVPAGCGISYGHTFVTCRPSRIAVLPVGYDDGYLRRLSNRAQVLIRGRRIPLVGTICMNACMADVTEHADIEAGDEVVLLGQQDGQQISAEEIARWSGTISYEILCLLGSRNQRRYVEG